MAKHDPKSKARPNPVIPFKVSAPRWCHGCNATVVLTPCPACQARRWLKQKSHPAKTATVGT